MIITALIVIVICAFITGVVAAMGKCPIWVPVILLAVAAMVAVLPGGMR